MITYLYNLVLRGALNPLPPELLQSLMQVAGHFMDRPPRTTTTATSTVNSSTESSTAQSSVGASQSAASGQNSQVIILIDSHKISELF